MIPRVTDDVLESLERNKEQVANALELTLLARELPDRLLIFEAIKGDPQIDAARDLLLKGDSKYQALLSPPVSQSDVLAKSK